MYNGQVDYVPELRKCIFNGGAVVVAEQWIYLDGQYVTKENAKVSVYDHGFCMEMGFSKGFVFTMAIFLDVRLTWIACMIRQNPSV